ncbi:outer membrane beta-barrel protein [Parasediminibacterium sp. JCM 36343]|uniref:outer membrane beta-barrel protein n=1 Tax=Parasediminibacterium sp. JCM 36343 TaxID=3374279 RepID=UPI00397C41E0
MRDQTNFDDFEQFLQDEAGNIKMFPSDHVWNNIAKKVQPKKSWPALTIIAFVIVLSISVATFFNYPPDNILTKIKFNDTNHSFLKVKQDVLLNNLQSKDGVAAISNDNKLKDAAEKPNYILKNKANKGGLTSNFILSNELPIENYETATATGSKINLKEAKGGIAVSSYNHLIGINQLNDEKNESTQTKGLIYSDIDLPKYANINIPIIDKQLSAQLAVQPSKTTTKKQIASDNKPSFALLSSKDRDAATRKEKAVLPNRLDYEIYTTPSISYRRLEDDQVSNQLASTPTAAANTINKEVRHRAALGTELGLGIRYKLASNLTFKTGLQFNIRQYYIDAYRTAGLATIKIVQNNKLDSVNVVTGYSNDGGGLATAKLDNKLYQLSIPVGVEWNLYNKKRFGINLSASIQPTLSLNRNVYIISTDYKYYANGESFFRHWNINSSLEANVSYKLKKSTLYVGPQMRYQHLPTYTDKYPIKEYRMDYGIKVGIIRPIK